MMTCRILAANGFQTMLRLHRFRTGGLCQLLAIDLVEYLGALSLEGFDMSLDRFGHVATARDNQSAIACASSRFEHAVFIRHTHQQTLGDVVAVETGAVNVEDGLDEIRRQLAHGVNGELHEQFVLLSAPHVAYGQQHEEVVVGLSPLQEALAALHIFHEVGGIAPDGVRGTHIDRGIELPAGPRIVLR